MNFTESKSNIKEIREGDPGFYISDGMTIAGRAGLVIHPDCPKDHAFYIHQALSRKYISLTSRVYDNELMWETLSK